MVVPWNFYAVALAHVLCFGQAQQTINLSNLNGWTLRDANHSISIPAQGQSQQYIDLYNAGIINDPLYGFNDTEQTWVQQSNWTYISPSLADLQVNNGTQTWFVFEGLDTFASISLCNQIIGNTSNQFRQYVFDVTDALCLCTDPVLSIDFASALESALAVSTGPNGDPYLNAGVGCDSGDEVSCKIYLRKEQNDFGWDWSPSLSPAGPWRPIYAVQLSNERPIYVNNALVDIYRQGQINNLPADQTKPWVFNASLDFVGELPLGASLELTLSATDGRTILQRPLSDVYSSNATITGSTTIDASLVELWWPNGMGEQNLYHAILSLTDGHNRTLTAVKRRVGFRSIVLDLSPISETLLASGISPGSNWNFHINGVDFYAKGSNFVPPDAFWPRVNETKIRRLFELAKEGHQNMIRIWSSGVYLDDWIYDIADEFGIFIWSEFQFTDNVYPATPGFLADYEAEAYYNIRRVNYHPSLALWAGGNELELIQLLLDFNYTSPTRITQQYQLVFEELLIKCVYANTRSISYIPSSTYNGYLSFDYNSTRPQIPRYNNRTSSDALYSDSDYYNYDAAQAFNISRYALGRFAAEFGFPSLPSLQSWKEAADPDELYLDSSTVVHHNRHYTFFGGPSIGTPQQSRDGIAQMTTAVQLWYPVPNISESQANFSAWIYTTQVFQADYNQHLIAFYRRGSGTADLQRGALFWQLDDLWVAPTWSAIEANGRQKILYYVTKDIFSPVIVYGYYDVDTRELQVWVTSDLQSSVSGTVKYEWFDWAGRPLSLSPEGYGNSSATIPFTVGAVNSTQVLRYPDLSSTLSSSGYNSSNAVLRLSSTGKDNSTGEEYSHTQFFTTPGLNDSALQDPELKLTPSHGPAGISEYTVTATKAVAAWVWLDYSTNAVKGHWSENGFWLAKGESKTVTFTVWDDWSDGTWADTVTVRSLWNNTLG